jgi:hypothetical protein
MEVADCLQPVINITSLQVCEDFCFLFSPNHILKHLLYQTIKLNWSLYIEDQYSYTILWTSLMDIWRNEPLSSRICYLYCTPNSRMCLLFMYADSARSEFHKVDSWRCKEDGWQRDSVKCALFDWISQRAYRKGFIPARILLDWGRCKSPRPHERKHVWASSDLLRRWDHHRV